VQSFTARMLLLTETTAFEKTLEYSSTVPSLPALGPWTPSAERGPSLKSIYHVALTVDLCEG